MVSIKNTSFVYIIFALICVSIIFMKLGLSRYTTFLEPYSIPIIHDFENRISKLIINPKSPILHSKSMRVSCVVLVDDVMGRLGNKLFMFASAYGIARTHDCYLYIKPTFLTELKTMFDFDTPFLVKSLNFSEVSSSSIQSLYNDCIFQESLMRPYAFTYFELKGYWQAYGHFAQYANEIRSHLQFKSTIINTTSFFLRQICSNISVSVSQMTFSELKHYITKYNEITLVGVHIRRGDFLNPQLAAHGRTVSSNEFLFGAMEYFSKRYNNRVLFIVASDEKRIYTELFRNNSKVYITPTFFSPAEDLAILALCDSSIITGGSFGWWSGFLANGIVIHDKKYPLNNSALAQVCPRIWYFPPWFLFL